MIRAASTARAARRLGGNRILAAVFSGALLATLLGTVSMPASATPLLETASSSSPSANLSNNSNVTLKTDAPFSIAGTSTETITQTFDTSTAPVKVNGSNLPDITTPEGYAVEYFYSGAWHSTAPAAVSGVYPTLEKVRATGSDTVAGWDSATSTQSYTRTAASVQAPARSFAGSGLGDGWDVFFGTGAAKGLIFNVYHHGGGDVGFECHNQRDGTSCWTNGNFRMGNGQGGVAAQLYSSAHSTGFYVASGDRAYTFVANGSTGKLGMACIENVSTASPSACATPFVVLGSSSVSSYADGGDAVRIGSKVYARGSVSGQNLLCFDLNTQTACAGQPINIGAPAGNGQWMDNRLLAVGNNVFFSTGTKLGCYDTVNAQLCSTFNGGATLTAASLRGLFYTEDNTGTPDQVCAYGSNSGNRGCWKLDGTAGTWPAGMTYYTSSITDGWGALHNSDTRLFYISSSGTAACFDFLTGAACSGFTAPTLGSYAYAFATDPNNTQCVWNNSDAGVIKNMDWSTGLPCGQKAIVMFRYTDSVPRLSCADSGRVTSWGSLTLHAPRNLAIADARVTVYTEGGSAVAGWVDVTVPVGSDTQTGTLDLSSLTVAQSGLHPAFHVSFVGADDVTGTIGDFAYSASAPQVCAVVKNYIPCPTGIGQGSPDFPYSLPALAFSSLVEYTGAVSGTQSTSAAPTRSALTASQCLLQSSTGYVKTAVSLVAIPGVVVYLYGPDTTTALETATSGANGYFEFLTLYPSTYTVSLSATGVAGISSSAHAFTCKPVDGACTNSFGNLLIPYKVHYDGNGSTSGTAPVDDNVSPGQSFALNVGRGTLVKDHYHFLGWALADTATAAVDTFTIVGDQTVYAVWEIDTHTLTASVIGGGSVNPSVGVHVYNYGDTTTVVPSAQLGWAFTGWTGACLGAGACALTIDANKAVTATFTKLYNLDVTINGAGSVSPGGGAYLVGTKFTFSPIPGPGYRFVGFSGDCTGTTCSITMDTDHKVTVTFVAVFPVSAAASGNGKVVISPASASGLWDKGSDVTLTATPDAGWFFTGWSGDCSGVANPLTVNVQKATNCTATFVKGVSATVTVAGSGTAAVSPSANADGVYLPGSAVTFTAAPAAGWAFSGWSGDCSGSTNPLAVTLATSKSCKATFTQVFSLTTQVVGNGSISASVPLDKPLAIGTTVQLTAKPGASEVFVGWTGACSGTSSTVTVTMDAAKSCIATFVTLKPVPSGSFAPVSEDSSHIVFLAADNATEYDITVEGKVVCTTSALECDVPMLLGPKSKVFAIAKNSDLTATPTRLLYKASGPAHIFTVHFAENSYVLAASEKAILKAVAVKVLAVGFTTMKVAGYTDNQGGSKGAATLSKNRANAVIKYLSQFIKVTAAGAGYGNTNFVASNDSEAGRAANRRADGWVQ